MKNFAHVLWVENWICFFGFLYLSFKTETLSRKYLANGKIFQLNILWKVNF